MEVRRSKPQNNRSNQESGKFSDAKPGSVTKSSVEKFGNIPRPLRGNQGKGKRSREPEVSWLVRRELDPSCSEFPLRSFGPVQKGAKNEDYLFTVRLAFDQAVTSDGSGAIASVISNSPVQAQNWTGYAAVFDEYRVLAMKVKFEPFWTVNCTFAPIASVIDRSDSTALTGYGLAERYASHKKAMGKAQFSQTINMSSVDEAGFTITSAPAANAWVKLYSSGNTASFTFGRLNVIMLVQFRGVGIN